MKDKPYESQGFEAENTILVIAPYVGDDNETTDKDAADAALNLQILIDEANWAGFNGGIAETSLTGGITSVTELADIITILMGAAWESLNNDDVIMPIVLYKGKAIPYEHYYDVESKTGTFIKIDNGATGGNGIYSDTAADYVVYLYGGLLGKVKSAPTPDVTLPLTVTKTKIIGHGNPVRITQKREGKDTTGKVTFLYDNKMIFHAAAGGGDHVMNSPGEDVWKKLFGADWQNSPNWNDLDYNDKVFAVSIIKWSGKSGAIATDVAIGKVFAEEIRSYHCQLTNLPADANIEGGAAESITFDIEFNAKFGARRRVILFITDGATGSKLNT